MGLCRLIGGRFMILIAVEKDNNVYVYSEERQTILSRRGNLYNYNQHYVAIKRLNSDDVIDIFDSNGNLVCTYPQDIIDLSNINGIVI